MRRIDFKVPIYDWDITIITIYNEFCKEQVSELIDEFENVYRTIQWESEAATAYTAKFTRLKEELITSFNDLKKQFAELMLQAEQDIEQAEKANTVQ